MNLKSNRKIPWMGTKLSFDEEEHIKIMPLNNNIGIDRNRQHHNVQKQEQQKEQKQLQKQQKTRLYQRNSGDEVFPEIGGNLTTTSIMKPKLRSLSSDDKDNEQKSVRSLTPKTRTLLLRQRKISDTYMLGLNNDQNNNDNNVWSDDLNILNNTTNSTSKDTEIQHQANMRIFRKCSNTLPPIQKPITVDSKCGLEEKYYKCWKSKKHHSHRAKRGSLIEEETKHDKDYRPLSLDLFVTSSPEFQQVFRDLSTGYQSDR